MKVEQVKAFLESYQNAEANIPNSLPLIVRGGEYFLVCEDGEVGIPRWLGDFLAHEMRVKRLQADYIQNERRLNG
jgi:hypothetical protein